MKNESFVEAFRDVRLSPEAKTRTVTAALDGAGRRCFRRVPRPLAAALAAVAAVCLVSGTALAVSPALRELLWGGFEPYVQVLEPTEENTQVYDGVEARIVSALSDGHINKVHIEVRDLTGDRVRQAWQEYQQTGDRDFLGSARFQVHVEDEEALEMAVQSTGSSPEPIGFDEETGAMILEAFSTAAYPLEMDRVAYVAIMTGAFGTVADTATGAILGPDGVERPIRYTRREGWQLTAPITPIPVRGVDIGTVTVLPESWEASHVTPEESFEFVELEDPNMYFHSVDVSQLGITLNRDGDVNDPDGYFELRTAPDELTVTFRNGASVTLSGDLASGFITDRSRYSSETWLFPDPVDPESVASVTLGGVEIPLR